MTPRELLAKFEPMSYVQDLRFVAELLKCSMPKNLIEFGAGSGGWILTMNHLVPGIQFTAVENFSNDFGFGWPKTTPTWLLNIHSNAFKVGDSLDVKIIDRNAHEVEFEDDFAAVRFDCLANMKDVTSLIDRILPYSTDDCLFLVDDISPNTCPGRFLAFMEKTKKNELFPVWFGYKEGAWCKNVAFCEKLQETLRKEFGSNHMRWVEINDTVYPIYFGNDW